MSTADVSRAAATAELLAPKITNKHLLTHSLTYLLTYVCPVQTATTVHRCWRIGVPASYEYGCHTHHTAVFYSSSYSKTWMAGLKFWQVRLSVTEQLIKMEESFRSTCSGDIDDNDNCYGWYTFTIIPQWTQSSA